MNTHLAPCIPRRNAPFDQEPGYYEPANLWLYGNARLLSSRLLAVHQAFGPPEHSPDQLDHIEHLAEDLVLGGGVLVTGVHNAAHQRAAVVPLRWGSPRILVFSGGFYYHLGTQLNQEPFRAARLWRYEFDPKTDLVISRRAPEKFPTYSLHNPTVDRLILRVTSRTVPGTLFGNCEFQADEVR